MKNEQALVSVITPCYNGEDFLDKYFESILGQTYNNLELILVNDGSTDRTEDIVNEYRFKLENRGIVFKYIKQENGGQANAMNTGFQKMKGEYLVWPDSDDLLRPDSIEKRVDFLEKNPEYSFVRSNGYFFDYDTKEKLYRISNLENRFNEDIFMDLILEKTYCCCGCYMIRTKILKEFYPDLKIYESSAGQNWQILIPIASKYKCGFIDEDMYFIAVRKNSHSRQKRSLEETIDRYKNLKHILEIAINLSKRNDKEYDKILEIKYQKIYMRTYLTYNDITSAKKSYQYLHSAGAIEENDFLIYTKKVRPILYRIYQIRAFVKRGYNKAKRILNIKKEK